MSLPFRPYPGAAVVAEGVGIPIGQTDGFGLLAVSAIALALGCAIIAPPARRNPPPEVARSHAHRGDALATVPVGFAIAPAILALIPGSLRSSTAFTIIGFGSIAVGIVLLVYLARRLRPAP